MSAPSLASMFEVRQGRHRLQPQLDIPLLLTVLTLLGVGLVMVGSASVTMADRQFGDPFHFLYRQAIFIAMGLGMAALCFSIPLKVWERLGPYLLLGGMLLLLLVLIPGLGRTVNGSTRWIHLGPINMQVSELVKITVVIYLAGYLVRRSEEVRTTASGFLKPMVLLALLAVLLLIEPDFGSAVVILATAMAMMFLAGVRLWLFGLLVLLVLGALAVLAISSPYRLERLTTFLNPWADPFNSGFQLTQALIAFGRGEWFGVGLGGSIQKMFYLPEAHTDFLFAVMAEELGLGGTLGVIALFSFFIWRGFHIARRAMRAGMVYGAYLAYGITLWLGMQAYINMGVNMGILPTKGLTLPLMSYGGSSMIGTCLALALLFRVHHETVLAAGGGARRVTGGAP